MGQPVAYYDPARVLVRVVELDDVIEHPNADRLDIVVVEGWQVVVGRGQWKKGDKALYCEIGSLLPFETVREFVDAVRDKNTKTFGGVNYAYIKSIKLRSEISQGFVCKIPAEYANDAVNTDLTIATGALKYEVNGGSGIRGLAAGDEKTTLFRKIINFITGELPDGLLPYPNTPIGQTSEERVQNMAGRLRLHEQPELIDDEMSYEVTVKLDGNSLSLINTLEESSDETEWIKHRLCSRTREIPLEPVIVSYWKAFRIWLGSTLNTFRRLFSGATKIYWPRFTRTFAAGEAHFKEVYGKLAAGGLFDKVCSRYWLTGELFSFQGEVIGPGVTAGSRTNHEGVAENTFYCFAVYRNGVKLNPIAARQQAQYFGLNYVPNVNTHFKLPASVKEILELADGPRALAKGGKREGLVFRRNDGKVSFKAVSNQFLLKHDDE